MLRKIKHNNKGIYYEKGEHRNVNTFSHKIVSSSTSSKPLNEKIIRCLAYLFVPDRSWHWAKQTQQTSTFLHNTLSIYLQE